MCGFAICRPRCDIVYVGLEILDDPDRTADARYTSAWVDLAGGGIVDTEDGFK